MHGRSSMDFIYACANILMHACPRMYAFPRMHKHTHACIHARIYACADVLMCNLADMTAPGDGVISENSQRREKNTDVNRKKLTLNVK